MAYFFAIIALGIAWVCRRRQVRYRTMLQDLANAIEARNIFLLDNESARQCPIWNQIQKHYNQLQESHRLLESSTANELQQIEATLGQLQETVIILDKNGKILSANNAATRFFKINMTQGTTSIYSVIKSSQFLDYMQHIQEGGGQTQREISIEQEGKLYWFETSGIRLFKNNTSPILNRPQKTEAYLFVLHDITRLKNLENIRQEFVANVSHELRTPVTIIKGFTDTLIHDHRQLKVEDREKFLLKIHRNVERLFLLLEDLLSLSRLESDRITLNSKKILLESLVGDALEQIKHRLKPEQRAEIELDPTVTHISVDELKFSQVLNNILDNAVRYAKGFTVIRISTRKENDMLWFSIEDNGQGIPEKDLPHLFERFYRVDKGRGRENGGTGLGLSIVKHIVLMHGGEVRAESELNKGTKIVFSVPV